MKKQEHDYILKMFTEIEDKLRPAMKEISVIGDNVYACTVHAMAVVKKENCVKNYTEIENYPSADKVFYDNHERVSHRISIDDLISDLIKIELYFERHYEECDECDGTGEIVCHCCGGDAYCDACNGTGQIATKFVKAKSKKELEIFEKIYDPDFFNKIVISGKILGEEFATIKQRKEGDGATIIEIGEMSFLIMEKMRSY
ncbi:MAG TPA: hypothetical protein VFD91_17425 [Mariniphaga sp.]|nr:hypothetical protein [Mariniphaga sp.]